MTEGERKPGPECVQRGYCIFTLGAARCTTCGRDRFVIYLSTQPNCEICFGTSLVCEDHPLRPWDSGTPFDSAASSNRQPHGERLRRD